MHRNTPLVKIGLIGAGSRLRGIVRQVLQESGHRVQVAAVYDTDPLSIDQTKVDFGENVVVCDSEETLVRENIDWVFIGSFNCFHSRQSILALKAGKNVFCEKPLGTSLEECLAVKDAVRTSGRRFAFGLVLRYSPHYQKLQELVSSGAIGKIISFEFNETLDFNHGGYIFGNWRRNRALAGTHLLEKCCHDLDLANWIIDSLPVSVASFGGRNFFTPENAFHSTRLGSDAEGRPAYNAWPDPHHVNPFSAGADILDNQVAILKYANGVHGTFHTNCNAGIHERRFYLMGSEGTIRADAITGKIELRRIEHGAEAETFFTGSSNSHGGGDEVMAQGLVRTLLEGVPPLASVDHGVQSCIVAFAIDQALEEKKIVDLNPWWNRVEHTMSDAGEEKQSGAFPAVLS